MLDIPITFNKFINFTVNQLQESQRAINIYWKKKKCYLNLNIEKNKEIIQIIFPSCQFDQNEQEIKYYGNFSFCESLQFKNIFFYELVHNFDEKDSELKIGYEAEKADDQEILDLLLKKICNDYAVLISELLL